MVKLVFYGVSDNLFCVDVPDKFKTAVPKKLELHRHNVSGAFTLKSALTECGFDVSGCYDSTNGGWKIRVYNTYSDKDNESDEFIYEFQTVNSYQPNGTKYKTECKLIVYCPDDIEITNFYHGHQW